MRAFPESRRSVGQANVPLIAGAVVVILILVVVYFLWPQPEPTPIPAPDQPRTTPLETVAPAKSAQERGDTARDVIKSLQNAAVVDYSHAHLQAREFHAAGSLADAQLLYFFAARGGYGPAAFELATMYDPLHFSARDSLMAQPDAFQAYKWYRGARDAGDDNAITRLGELRAWAAGAADAGDEQARRLLMQWE